MDNFEILEKLGDGAYSVVYKVKRKQDSQIYALKKVKLQNLNEKEKAKRLKRNSYSSKYKISLCNII